jgi:hypothetical protein
MKDNALYSTELRNLIGILIGSPFYLSIPVKERYALIKRLVSDYDICSDIKQSSTGCNDEEAR